ncbi:hypothetical protein [Bartonella grahamii]|nr:hypothetical protein [Bartonella grahamii]
MGVVMVRAVLVGVVLVRAVMAGGCDGGGLCWWGFVMAGVMVGL